MAESAWPDRLRDASRRFVPAGRPSPAWRFVPAALVLIVLLVDSVLYDGGIPLFGVAVLDELAHLATTLIVLAGLLAAGVPVSVLAAVGAVVAGTLIDLDHVPQLLGATWWTTAPQERPYTHSLLTIVVVLVLTHLARRVTSRRDADRVLGLGLGAGIGLAAHFVRDASGGGTLLLWPLSMTPVAVPHALYLAGLVLAAGAWAVRGRWPVAEPAAMVAPRAADRPASRPRPASVDHRGRRGGTRIGDYTRTGSAPALPPPVAPETSTSTSTSTSTTLPLTGLHPVASRIVVALATIAYAWHMTAGMLARYHGLRLAGFDTGIFVQGTWLLSQGADPFVTVRGLPLLADHASFVLLLIAPLYALIPHPGFLLTLQTLGVASAALVLNAFFLRTGRVWPATVFPLVYLAYPAQQWGATFEFHPESLAPVFLVLTLHLAVHHRRRGLWLIPLIVALSCKEDMSFVVAGLGLLLFALGRRRRGLAALGVGIGYFLAVTSIVMPALGGGMTSIYFQKNFGIDTQGSSLGWVPHLPRIVEMFFEHATGDDGLLYLALVLVPVLLLAVADPKWLLPTAGPLFINLASQVDELHSIRFHYLLTSAPFIVIAAFYGYLRVSRALSPGGRRALLGAVTVVALVASAQWGAIPRLNEEAKATTPATRASAERAISMIPKDAAVSASWNMVPNLAQRRTIYDFPVPFDKGWWGKGDPPRELAAGVEYVVLQPEKLRDMDKAAYERLRSHPEWETLLDKNGILLLRRR